MPRTLTRRESATVVRTPVPLRKCRTCKGHGVDFTAPVWDEDDQILDYAVCDRCRGLGIVVA